MRIAILSRNPSLYSTRRLVPTRNSVRVPYPRSLSVRHTPRPIISAPWNALPDKGETSSFVAIYFTVSVAPGWTRE